MNGLKSINIELTSRCNKSCWMCGRRKMEKDYPELADWGDMPFEMLKRIAGQIPKGVFIQLHNNGEPLLYPHFAEACKLFENHYVGLDTNGKLLMEQNEPIRAYLSSITISIIPDDMEGNSQLAIAEKFLEYEDRPLVIFRMLKKIDVYRNAVINAFVNNYPRVLVANRQLHSPDGSFDYEKPVTIPEHGVCEEMLHKLCIDRYGNVYPCVRFDPHKKNKLGEIKQGYDNLDLIWDQKKRLEWVQHHIDGRRDLVPLCSECDYWGVPSA